MELKFDGLLFDLDGTLLDSSEVIARAWAAFAHKYHLDIRKILPSIQGKPAREAIETLRPGASYNEVSQDADWLEQMETNDTDGVIALPGAADILNTLNNAGIPWAIVTSGTLPVATARIKAAALPFPKVLITPEQVSRGKPDPEPYILGAQKLGMDVKKCIVFEDAPAGIQSGSAAGAATVGILTQFDESQLLASNATVCIQNLLAVSYSADNNQHLLVIQPN